MVCEELGFDILVYDTCGTYKKLWWITKWIDIWINEWSIYVRVFSNQLYKAVKEDKGPG